MEELTEVLLNKNINNEDTVAADFDKKEGKIFFGTDRPSGKMSAEIKE